MRPVLKVWMWVGILLFVGALAVAGSVTRHVAGRSIEQAKKPSDFPRDMELIQIKHKLREGTALTAQQKRLFAQAHAAHSSRYAPNPLDNQGGPDQFGYLYLDNVAPDTATFNWIELCGDNNATDGPTGDDDDMSIPIGFTFPFYGTNYTDCYISTNGLISFGGENTNYSADDPGATVPLHPYVAPFWFDGNTAGGGTAGGCNQDANGPWIRYRSFGTYLVVEWKKMPQFDEPDYATFEAIIYQSGSVKVQFGSDFVMPGVPGLLGNVGVGIDGPSGTDGLSYGFWPNSDPWIGNIPAASTAIWFVLPNGVPGPVTNLQGTANGSTVTLTWTDPTQDTNGNPLTPDSILIYRGTTQADSQVGHVAAGAQTFVATNQPDGNLMFIARAKHGTWLSAPTGTSLFVGAPGYANNFDTDNGGWVADGLWTWGATTNPEAPQPHSGTNCWGTGMDADYPDNACSHLDLNPQLDILSATATLEFWAWWSTYEFENDDAINVKISVDEGQTWQLLTPRNGYGNTAPTYTACVPGEEAWSNISNGWRYIVIPIGDYAGQTPWFRFTFGSYTFTGNQYPGFFFDDMSMWGVGPRPNGVPQPVTNLHGSAGGTTNVTLTWTDPSHDTNGNPLTPDSILVYRGNPQPGSQIGHVAGGVQTISLADQPVGNVTYYVRAKAGTWISSFASVSVLVGNPSYFSDFDSDNGDWVADNGIWQWGAPSNPQGPQPHSGTNVWSTGLQANYNNSTCGHLDLSPDQQVNSPAATIEFWYWYQIEQGFDGCNVKVSVDEGNTWEIVTPNDGYPGVTNGSWSCGGEEAAWTGPDATGWRYAVIPIGQYINQTPIFRFTFGSDGSVTYAGYFLDDVIIWGLAPRPDGQPLPVTNLQGTASGTTTATLTWTDPDHDTNGNPLTPDSILIYRDASDSTHQIAHVANGVQTVALPNQPIGSVNYYVRAKHAGYLSSARTVNVMVGAPVYTQDFENDNGGWVAGDGLWEWGAPTNTSAPVPHSGSNLWGTGLSVDYPNNACNHLDLDLGLDVTSSNAVLDFWAWWSLYPFPEDGCNIMASVDGGTTWQIITPEGGYPNLIPTFNTCLPGDSGWCLASNDWRHVIIPIGQFLNQAPMFRFSFGSTPFTGNQFPGFFFDDMKIWGLHPAQQANISGHVTINGGTGDVTQVLVAANGLGSPTTHPAANGDYTLTGAQVGHRRLLATLANYFQDTLEIELDSTGYTGADLVVRRLPPPAPTSLTSVVLTTARKDSLHWVPTTDLSVDGYRLYRKLSADPTFTFRQNVWGRTTVFVKDTLEQDGVYDFVVTALDTDMVILPWSESANSDTASSPFGHLSPLNLTADGNFDDHIHLAWNGPTTATESYLLYDNGINDAGGIGWGGQPSYGWLVAHYQTDGPVTVKGVRAFLTQNATLGSPLQAGVFADDGTGRPNFTPLAVVSGTVDAPLNTIHEWTLSSPLTIDSRF
jgi:hypothetical protein